MNELLMKCAVVQTKERGLLGNIKAMTASGDGSTVRSQANGSGKKACACKERCSCPRSYADPTATWGFDSRGECYYFGYRLHVITVHVYKTDLPLYLSIDAANNNDAPMVVPDLIHLQELLDKRLPGARIDKMVFDLGYDSIAFHKFLISRGIRPIIPLKPSTKKASAEVHGVTVNADNIPLCKAKIPMAFQACNHQRDKILIYRCPAKSNQRKKNGEKGHEWVADVSKCPLGELCQPESTMGPFAYIHSEGDPRRFPSIPRETETFKEAYKERTASERIFSQCEGKGLKKRCFRRRHLALLYSLGIGIRCHIRAWMKQMEWKKAKTFDAFEKIIQQMLS